MEETITDSVPNPAASDAQAEMRAVMTDSAHPLHHAYMRNDHEAVQRHMKPYYDKITGPSSITLGEGIEITGRPASQPAPQPAPHTEAQAETLSPEDRVAVEEHNRLVRETLGDEHDTVSEEARRGVAHLFGSDPEGVKAFEFLAKRIYATGDPAKEVQALRYLADLGRDLTL